MTSQELTDREMLIARKAAEIAVREVANEFYRQVGRSVVTKLLIWLGMVMVAWAAGKGLLHWPE